MPYVDREVRREYGRFYRTEHREILQKKKKQWRAEHKEALREHKSFRYIAFRGRLFDLLGGTCVRCGEADRDVLCVDHINGGGKKDSRRGSDRYRRYLKELEAGVAGKYQILCHNCNWRKRVEHKEFGRRDEGRTSVGRRVCARYAHARLKKLLVDALGGKCTACGEDDIRILQIDHVNGDGAEERRSLSPSSAYRKYLAAVRAGSDRYGVLCPNDNYRKRLMSDKEVRV